VKSKASNLSQSLQLKHLRELVRQQQALHHTLVQLQQTAAGIATRHLLNELYREGAIDEHEYLTFKLASGEDEAAARASLAKTLKETETGKEVDPNSDLLEPALPQYSGPKRTARKPPKRASELRGHPLD